MSRENNFLIGNGERLTTKVKVPTGGGLKNPAYEFKVARQQISVDLNVAVKKFGQLPESACPHDLVTAAITMHPRYISKSDFPTELFEEVGLKSVGGRGKRIKPRNWGVKSHPEDAITDEILVMGTRKNFLRWANTINRWTTDHRGAKHIPNLEDLNAFMANSKIKQVPYDSGEVILEVVLHACNDEIIDYFDSFAEKCGSRIVRKHLRFTDDIAFIPVHTEAKKTAELAEFSFIRVLRVMPKMRLIQPSPLRSTKTYPVKIPQVPAINSDIRVAIFDGGIPANSLVTPWVNAIEPSTIGYPVPAYQKHGLAVTSAFLFGPLDKYNEAPYPLCNVDHIRVIDNKSGRSGDYEYYDILDRILEILDAKDTNYDFVNISLGPDIPVDDDEITRWTASIDQRFAGGKMLGTIAVGNNGDLDAQAGLNRIQPPSDAVNVISVGASDIRNSANWTRADYSCMGPGRCPGIVKPDGVIFGGSDVDSFLVLSSPKTPNAVEMQGTSIASPYALRTATSVRTQLGTYIQPLAIRALLIHRADPGDHDITSVGWGLFETDYERLITCDDDEALVIFQGEMPVGEHLRAPIPLPDGELEGMVSITATLVIAPEVDPSYPNAYTRSGLEVSFRPNSEKFKPNKDGNVPRYANTKSFFSQKKIYGVSEVVLRGEGHKWEPCLKATQRFNAKTLKQPCFDIYYHNRFEGMKTKEPKPIPYALIVSIQASKVKDLYDRVVRTYSNILVPIRPQFRIQIQK